MAIIPYLLYKQYWAPDQVSPPAQPSAQPTVTAEVHHPADPLDTVHIKFHKKHKGPAQRTRGKRHPHHHHTHRSHHHASLSTKHKPHPTPVPWDAGKMQGP